MITALLLLACQEPAGPLGSFTAVLGHALAEDDPEALYDTTSAAFQEQVPLRTIRTVVTAVRQTCGAPLELEVDPAGWERGGFQHLVRAAGPRRVALFRVSLDAEGRVAGLLQQFEAPVWSAEELVAALDSWPGDFGVAGACIPAGAEPPRRFERHAGRETFPLGSIFKVYVLAEVARRIGSGELSWDQPLALREEWKSLPSGTMQNEPAGAEFPVREYVRRMIGISDNTATDHLLWLVGRDAVEAGLAACRNSVPERNQPFLSTRELFFLKGLPDSAAAHGGDLGRLAADWKDTDPAVRRAWLAEATEVWAEGDTAQLRASAAIGYGLRSLAAPAHLEIEWFAAPEDLVALYLEAAADRLYTPGASAAFREGLAYGAPLYQGPGVSYHGFKGGSETGVFALSLLLRLDDGRTAAVCVCRSGFPPADAALPQASVDAATALARALLEGRVGAGGR
ncbi:MAG: hypothetical protein EYC70_04855 [Planctomycetota bacterium]|nr:MAG: hypothetical protein EYC70_04855 [Planctomycetota bacterium]